MRALGPGSVSSILKITLDVVHFVLWLGLAGVTIAIVAVLLISSNPGWLGSHLTIDSVKIDTPGMGPIAAGVLLGWDIYLAGALVVVGGLRQIFQTLVAGDPFHPDNVRRLRVIGAAIAVLEVIRYPIVMFAPPIFHRGFAGGINLSAWFAILVIFVLAEVFREGARLRRDAELTI